MIVTRFVDSILDIPAADWDALRPDSNPFLSHAFLAGLELHGCLQPRFGWRPHHLGLWREQRLVAAAPCYLKHNSHGEFVFDHGWAEAYHRHGLAYFPKLLCAVPYSPVSGPRLLCSDPALVPLAAAALIDEVQQLGLSSAHINFLSAEQPAPGPAWLQRRDWQFHWRNRGWADFDAFLAALSSKKRKNIRHERSEVQQAGVRFRWLDGATIDDVALATMHRFYVDTFAAKGNLPVLTLAFFRHLAQALPQQFLLVLAERRGQPIAGALLLRSDDTLYGRYWGSDAPLPGLHFETCYYQGIDYCLRHRLERFEPGAQGEHKLARGFLPAPTQSFHYVEDPRFRRAIAESLRQEHHWHADYGAELQRHSPYRRD